MIENSRIIPIPTEKSLQNLKGETEEQVISALAINDETAVWALISEMHHADIADLLERLNDEGRGRLLAIMGPEFDGDVLIELDETVRDQVISKVGLATVAQAISELESDDALEIIEELEKHDQEKVLKAIPDEDRVLIEESLNFPKDSAGRLMQREFVTVPTFWSVGDAIDFIRESGDSSDNRLPSQFYVVYVVDPAYRPVGMVWLDKLLRTRHPVKLTDVMEPDIKVIPVDTDQEDVTFLFRQRD